MLFVTPAMPFGLRGLERICLLSRVFERAQHAPYYSNPRSGLLLNYKLSIASNKHTTLFTFYYQEPCLLGYC